MSKIIKILSILALFISRLAMRILNFGLQRSNLQNGKLEAMAKSFEAKTGIKSKLFPLRKKI